MSDDAEMLATFYRIRPAVAGDKGYARGAILEVNDTDPPEPIWKNGFFIPADRLWEISVMVECAAEMATGKTRDDVIGKGRK